MSEDEIYSKLNEIFADVFIRDDIKLAAETSARDIEGWDSFRMIEIAMAVEQRFAIKLHTRELDTLKNVSDLVKIINKKAG